MTIARHETKTIEASTSAIPGPSVGVDAFYAETSEETSHVFKCMECDLQLQLDTALIRHDATGSIDEFVRIQIHPVSTS
ncbi:MAG: hypothetical protein WCD86_21290 [Ktedonobacteraceae bacterium]|nr:hypothetical protein [Ktedonobacteraceae bacterium]